MKILVTGATGNIGKGLTQELLKAGHSLVLSDMIAAPEGTEAPYIQCDLQNGFGLEGAAQGCDMIVHLPAWHGIHWREKTEIDYWKLNIEGTFWMFQAAQKAGVKKVVFLSSQAWHGHFDKYGFTKRVGEELCEYNLRNHGISYVAVRPADLTPYGADYLNRFGAGFLYGRVHRDDVLQCILKSIQFLETADKANLVVDALRPKTFTEEDIADWETDPISTAEKIWPGYRGLIEKYNLNIQRKPSCGGTTLGWAETGYQPTYDFGSFLAELRDLDQRLGEDHVKAMTCPY